MKLLPLGLMLLAGGLIGWWTGGTPTKANASLEERPSLASSKLRVNVISPETRQRVQQVRQARTSADRLREVVILATNLPLAEFPRWFEGNYLNFLDGGAENLFYQILTDRWLAAQPAVGAQWMLEHGKGSASKAIACWAEVDEAAAIAYVSALPAARRQGTTGPLVVAVGKRSVPDALDLLDKLRDPSLYLEGIVGKLAVQDRAAVMDYSAGTAGERRRQLLTEVIGAWLETDLRWVVGMMQKEGLGPETFEHLANTTSYGTTGRTLLEQAAFLPTGWLEQLSERRLLTLGAEIEWLNTKSGKQGLPSKVLQKLQIQAASMPWWYNDKRDAGLKLVEHGDWLPLDARAKIAETLALRWKDDPAAARKWVASLDGKLREAGEKGLAQMQAEMARNQQAKQPTTPADLMRAFADETITRLPSNINWSAAETSDALKLANQLAPDKAARVLPSIQSNLGDGLPRPVLGAMVARALEVPCEAESREQRQQTRAACELAADWAFNEPRQAADWVKTLPTGEARLWAAKNVALQWNHYSTAEVQAWANTLPEGERKAVLAVLTTPTNR